MSYVYVYNAEFTISISGHLDFYVNGGLLQPECEKDSCKLTLLLFETSFHWKHKPYMSFIRFVRFFHRLQNL